MNILFRSLILFLCVTSDVFCADIKEEIALTQKQINESQPQDRMDLYQQLALCYLKDQDQQKAFEAFLAGLSAEIGPQSPKDENDDQEIFTTYLNYSKSRPTKEAAEEIINKYAHKLQNPSQGYVIRYVLALAYANIGKYEEFVRHFYQAYKLFPDHFLAYKTKAIIHIKLLERASTSELRDVERKAVLTNLNLALTKCSQDTSLYKLLIAFSFPENKINQIRESLNKIISDNIIIPRTDIQIYVQEAVDNNEKTLAQRFINKAKEWYPNSRILQTAQDYLDKD